MKVQACLVAAVLLATPAAAVAAPGMITASVDLRAGPSEEFPVVNRLPSGVPVEVYGCIRRALWCDVSWGRERGWVAAQYLDYFYDGRYVALPSYVDALDVPVASFVLTSYWSTYYFGRPWYRRHAWWNRHWNTQTHVASQAPATPTAAAPAQAGHGALALGTAKPPAGVAKPPAGTAMMPPTAAMARGSNAAPAGASGQGTGVQAMRAPEGRMTARAAGQATAMRGAVPMAAHAQFGGSRGGIGGVPHAAIGGAAHNGGGGRDNGDGRRRH
jgi:uncharacterized protein YraI